jgi:hypothetical protein
MDELHAALNRLNHGRFRPGLPTDEWRAALATEHALRIREIAFLERERAAVAAWAAEAPRDAARFIGWFERLRDVGPGQQDPLFPWLAERATLDELRWFLRQEAAGEAGFDDLVALTQVQLPVRAKLELARNYWDEMGRGDEPGMHGPMLGRMVEELALDDTVPVVWESLALGNLMAGLAATRRYAFHAIGALGVVELTAPGRSAMTNAGLKRCGVAPHTRQYYALHATLDIKHSRAWNANAIAPLLEGNPDLAPAIAEGALMRLTAGARCFARYRSELGVAIESAA